MSLLLSVIRMWLIVVCCFAILFLATLIFWCLYSRRRRRRKSRAIAALIYRRDATLPTYVQHSSANAAGGNYLFCAEFPYSSRSDESAQQQTDSVQHSSVEGNQETRQIEESKLGMCGASLLYPMFVFFSAHFLLRQHVAVFCLRRLISPMLGQFLAGPRRPFNSNHHSFSNGLMIRPG